MKKVLAIAISALLMISLCACNMSVGIGNYSFKKIHIDTYHYSGCLTVESWHDNETGIEVKTEEAGSIYLSEGTYILISDSCPFCGEEDRK